MIKYATEKTLKDLTRLCKRIYADGEWPKDFIGTIMVLIEKKENATDCSDFSIILSLIPLASKIVLDIKKEINSSSMELYWRRSIWL